MPIYPYRKVGEISVISPKVSTNQITTRELDTRSISYPTPEDGIEKYLEATTGGVCINKEPSRMEKIKYWFRRTFRIKPKH